MSGWTGGVFILAVVVVAIVHGGSGCGDQVIAVLVVEGSSSGGGPRSGMSDATRARLYAITSKEKNQ